MGLSCKKCGQNHKLTFEFIRKNLVPMRYLLIDEDGCMYLYTGFSRQGYLITDYNDGEGGCTWSEFTIENWTYKEYNGN